jgi:uncharacterized protein
MKKANHLAGEYSPYLLQHAYNPVDWYPWGPEALEKAKKENKLILVSIGYSACHWCHVMEHESFEDEEVAEVMNTHFVSIKVDREERPDIDSIYMTAVQMITGGGGWPLNCFALPDGKPFYGGTYFRKADWINILKALAEAWEKDQEKIASHADELVREIVRHETVSVNSQCEPVGKDELRQIIPKLISYYDFEKGGTRGAPKFPLPVHYEMLLHYWWLDKFQPALEITELSLDKMAAGGIYDHLGGGFARYSVDGMWKVPHFEKMLYDNAQLISLYSKAYQITGKQRYREVVEETVDFVITELKSPEGGFYSAMDADSEGVEGKYYVWDEEEVDRILGKDSGIFKKYYNLTCEGNWEGSNILFTKFSLEEFADFENLNAPELKKILTECRKKLLNERNKRIKPLLDDKIIASWNGLMIKALCDAFRYTGHPVYREIAIHSSDFVIKSMIREDYSLQRTFKNKKGRINGFLDDYAMLTEAFMAVYEISFHEVYLKIAGKLIGYCIEHFHNPENGLFWYSSDLNEMVVTKTTELSDNVIPSSNSVMAINLYKYGRLMGNTQYIAMAEKMAGAVLEKATRSPINYMNWLRFLLTLNFSFYEVAVLGNDAHDLALGINREFNPTIITASSTTESDLPLLANRYSQGKNLFYVCRDHQCSLPLEDIEQVQAMIKNE